jgi:hypothetical protein
MDECDDDELVKVLSVPELADRRESSFQVHYCYHLRLMSLRLMSKRGNAMDGMEMQTCNQTIDRYSLISVGARTDIMTASGTQIRRGKTVCINFKICHIDVRTSRECNHFLGPSCNIPAPHVHAFSKKREEQAVVAVTSLVLLSSCDSLRL